MNFGFHIHVNDTLLVLKRYTRVLSFQIFIDHIKLRRAVKFPAETSWFHLYFLALLPAV